MSARQKAKYWLTGKGEAAIAAPPLVCSCTESRIVELKAERSGRLIARWCGKCGRNPR